MDEKNQDGTPRRGGNPNWKKGVSANPGGRPRGIERIVNDTIAAMTAEVEDPETKQKILLTGWQRLAKKLFELGMGGNVPAVKLLYERAFGYPKQNVKIDDANTQTESPWATLPIEKRRELLDLYERLGIVGSTSGNGPTEH